jgi:hypothetical protein
VIGQRAGVIALVGRGGGVAGRLQPCQLPGVWYGVSMGLSRGIDTVEGMLRGVRGVVCALGMLVGVFVGAGVMLAGSVAAAQSTPTSSSSTLEQRVQDTLRARIARFGGDEATIAARALASGDLSVLAGVPVRLRWRLQIQGPPLTPEQLAEQQLMDPMGANRPVRLIARELVAGPEGVRLTEHYPDNLAIPSVTIGWNSTETWMLRNGELQRTEVSSVAGGQRPDYARRAATSAVGDVIRLLRPELGGLASGAGAIDVRSVRVTGTRFEATLGPADGIDRERTTIRGRIEPRTEELLINEATLAGGERLELSAHVTLRDWLIGPGLPMSVGGETIARRVEIEVPAAEGAEALRATLWLDEGQVLDEALAKASTRAPEAMASLRQTVHPNMTNFVEGGRFWAEPMLPTIPTDSASPIGGSGGGGGFTQLLIGLAAATVTLVVLVLLAGRK